MRRLPYARGRVNKFFRAHAARLRRRRGIACRPAGGGTQERGGDIGQAERRDLADVGVALFDLEQPERLLLRGDEWIFGPEAAYETKGDVAKVTFPCGTTSVPTAIR